MNGNSRGGGENAVPANRIVADRRYLLSRPPSAYFDIRRYGLRYAGRSGPTEKVLHEILDMLYERLERPQRVSEAIRRLKERGVDEQVIRECLKIFNYSVR